MTFRGHMLNGVAVLDTPVSLPDGTPVRIEVTSPDAEFWSNRSVLDLAREQRIAQTPSSADLAGDWPEEDSVDEFLAMLREVRR